MLRAPVFDGAPKAVMTWGAGSGVETPAATGMTGRGFFLGVKTLDVIGLTPFFGFTGDSALRPPFVVEDDVTEESPFVTDDEVSPGPPFSIEDDVIQGLPFVVDDDVIPGPPLGVVDVPFPTPPASDAAGIRAEPPGSGRLAAGG